MIGEGLDTLSVTRAMQALRDGEFSAVELLQAVYEKYIRTEPVLHSWVELYDQEALAQAVVADRRFKATANPPPLLGIPVGIKDIFDIAGKATRCNSALRDDAVVAHRDAEVVHRLRKAGAVLFGKTVTQELAAGVISAPARNPWDPDRIPGGSSGGSAASVVAGTSLGAIGSDTGGSIRIPASLTGSVGLKPTWGRIDLRGTFPLSVSLDTAGPITRTVADAVAMYLAMANRMGEVWTGLDELFAAQELKGQRIGVLDSWFNDRVQPDVASAFTVACELLASLGAEVVECDWPDAAAAGAAAMVISRVESASLHHRDLRNYPEHIGIDVRQRLEIGALLTGDVYLRARQARQAVKASISDVFDQRRLDAVMVPTTPVTALTVDDPVARHMDGTIESAGEALTRFTMPWNATGQPVVSVPCGFDGNGLPIGLSFAGRPDRELALCRIAHVYEQAAGWYLRRPTLEEKG